MIERAAATPVEMDYRRARRMTLKVYIRELGRALNEDTESDDPRVVELAMEPRRTGGVAL